MPATTGLLDSPPPTPGEDELEEPEDELLSLLELLLSDEDEVGVGVEDGAEVWVGVGVELIVAVVVGVGVRVTVSVGESVGDSVRVGLSEQTGVGVRVGVFDGNVVFVGLGDIWQQVGRGVMFGASGE